MEEEPKQKVGATDWEQLVARPEEACGRCERAFSEGEEYVSALDLIEIGFARVDVCPDCFESEAGLFAYWRGRRPVDQVQQPGRKLDLAFLADFFRRLQDHGNEERYLPVAYIVSLVLLRRRILNQVRSEKDDQGRPVMVFTFKKDEDQVEYRVVEPELTPEKLGGIREDLGRIFNLQESPSPVSDEAPADDAESPVE